MLSVVETTLVTVDLVQDGQTGTLCRLATLLAAWSGVLWVLGWLELRLPEITMAFRAGVTMGRVPQQRPAGETVPRPHLRSVDGVG